MLSMVAAVYSGWTSDLGAPLERTFPSPGPGPARIIPTGTASPPIHAALAMASWSMVLDFDDVMLGGHTGHSAVLVPLAFGADGTRSGADLLLAQIVANEVAARVNMVCAVGATRGQMATHLHLLAAAAARAKLERLDETAFTAALSFALSYPARALYPAFLGSDAKALCAALPVRVGLEAVDAVQAGLTARADLLEDPQGLFAVQARVPVREFLGGLGERWHTETTSFKIYPVCGYLCSAVDATLDLVHRHDIAARDVKSVDVWGSLFTVGMDAHSAPYLDGPRSRISTLTFSTPFTIASAILARQFGPSQLKRQWIEDPRVWALAASVRSRSDMSLTIEALTADIPIGAALRRVRRLEAAGFAWSVAGTAFGRSGRWRHPAQVMRLVSGLVRAAGDSRPLDLPRSTKPLGARVVIGLGNGRTVEQSVSIPRGFAGATQPDAYGRTLRDMLLDKFAQAAIPVIGPEQAAETAHGIEHLQELSSTGVAHLLNRACMGQPQHERVAAR